MLVCDRTIKFPLLLVYNTPQLPSSLLAGQLAEDISICKPAQMRTGRTATRASEPVQ